MSQARPAQAGLAGTAGPAGLDRSGTIIDNSMDKKACMTGHRRCRRPDQALIFSLKANIKEYRLVIESIVEYMYISPPSYNCTIGGGHPIVHFIVVH